LVRHDLKDTGHSAFKGIHPERGIFVVGARGVEIVVVVGPNAKRQPDLLQMADATDPGGLLFRPSQRGNRDDCEQSHHGDEDGRQITALEWAGHKRVPSYCGKSTRLVVSPVLVRCWRSCVVLTCITLPSARPMLPASL